MAVQFSWWIRRLDSVRRLANVKGTLYGTTAYGGKDLCFGSEPAGCGTFFRITATGSERILYRFDSRDAGHYPKAPLTSEGSEFMGRQQRKAIPTVAARYSR